MANSDSDLNPIIIDSKLKLEESLVNLSKCRFIGVDIESAGSKRFSQSISLVQVSSDTVQYIFDPLNVSLEPLKKIFENSDIEKIFFDGIQDIQMIKRDLNCSVKSVFDISIAYQAIYPARDTKGLKDILQEFYEIEISKKLQRTDWERRPLTNEMVKYACLDVVYLIKLRHNFAEKLKEKRNYNEILRFCYSFELARPNNPAVQEKLIFLNIINKDKFSELEKLLIRRIHDYRVNRARTIDRPFYFVFGNDQLIKLVKEKPNSLKKLEKLEIKAIKSRKMKEKIVKIILGTTDDYSLNPLIFESEVKKFREIKTEFGRKNIDLLDDNLEFNQEVDYDVFKKQQKILRKWRNSKTEESKQNKRYFCPDLVIKELSLQDYSKKSTIPLLPGINEEFVEKYSSELCNILKNPDDFLKED
ncbi:MAG: HRDC domain-containing protein [Candidatus Hodarchaeales archaeon]|jgi:ribonuclease D